MHFRRVGNLTGSFFTANAISVYMTVSSEHTNCEVTTWIRRNRKKSMGRRTEMSFNSVTEKKKPENQNQEHNARKEAFDVKMRQV